MDKLSIRVGIFTPVGSKTNSVVVIGDLSGKCLSVLEYPSVEAALEALPNRARLVVAVLDAQPEMEEIGYVLDYETQNITMKGCELEIQGYDDLFSFSTSLPYLLGLRKMTPFALESFSKAGFKVEANYDGACVLSVSSPLEETCPDGQAYLALELIFNFDESSFWIRMGKRYGGSMSHVIEQDDYAGEALGDPVSLDEDIRNMIDARASADLTNSSGFIQALEAIMDPALSASVILTYSVDRG